LSLLTTKSIDMRMKFFIATLLFSFSVVFSYTQTQPAVQSQKKVVKINPVKADTNNANNKQLKKYSKEELYKTIFPTKKITDPTEQQAMDLYNAGCKKGMNGDYQGAIADYTKSLNLFMNVNTFMKRGYTYMMQANYVAAISDATDAIKIDPNFAKAYFVRGLSRFETKDYAGAEQDLTKSIDLDHSNAIAFNYMAALRFMKQDFRGALANYDEVVKLDPKYPDIYTNRGMMRHYLKDYNGAIQDYNEALKANPNNASAYNNRAAGKLMLKDFNGALADLNKAISLKKDYADAYDNRGRVKQAMGDLPGACADWNSAYSLGLDATKNLILKYCK
jgi:tetratricopeptide (TPR) repeat protein